MGGGAMTLSKIILLIGAFTLWLWRNPYVPPPSVHRDYTRPGDPPDPSGS